MDEPKKSKRLIIWNEGSRLPPPPTSALAAALVAARAAAAPPWPQAPPPGASPESIGWASTSWASFQAPRGAPRLPVAMLACAPPGSLSASPWAPPPGVSPGRRLAPGDLGHLFQHHGSTSELLTTLLSTQVYSPPFALHLLILHPS